MRKNMKPNENNTTSNNLLKFPKKVTNNDTNNKYELFNVVSETGDSIYYFESFEEQIGGQIFVAESKIEEIVNRIIDQRFGSSKNKKNE